MKTYYEFIEDKEVQKIHFFSNTGKTDRGVGFILSNYDTSLRRYDKILWSKSANELTTEERKEHEVFLAECYFRYLDKEVEAAKQYKEWKINEIKKGEKNNEFLVKYRHFVESFLPFSVYNDYDILRLNHVKGDTINNISEFDNLDDYIRICLTFAIVHDMKEIASWEDYDLTLQPTIKKPTKP